MTTPSSESSRILDSSEASNKRVLGEGHDDDGDGDHEDGDADEGDDHHGEGEDNDADSGSSIIFVPLSIVLTIMCLIVFWFVINIYLSFYIFFTKINYIF